MRKRQIEQQRINLREPSPRSDFKSAQPHSQATSCNVSPLQEDNQIDTNQMKKIEDDTSNINYTKVQQVDDFDSVINNKYTKEYIKNLLDRGPD